ncbi:hypothetical protein PSTT_07952 [Puccinia striiformis]|uniref:Uncharacterized protein n=1 Tax=Puccinia striiformis TaxID=27350 RepID=A0A2S4VEA1_9BASI|nr:hypothetical protein PSTT_07952 [Puccinia striiformis]
MFYQSSKDGRSAHFVLKNYSLTTPPFHVLLSTKRPIHAFKFDGPQIDTEAGMIVPLAIIWDLRTQSTSFSSSKFCISLPPKLAKKTNSLEKILILQCAALLLQGSFLKIEEREKGIACPRELIILHT